MEQSSSWEANRHSSSQDAVHFLWTPPQGSLPCSQQPVTGPGPDPESDGSSPHLPILSP